MQISGWILVLNTILVILATLVGYGLQDVLQKKRESKKTITEMRLQVYGRLASRVNSLLEMIVAFDVELKEGTKDFIYTPLFTKEGLRKAISSADPTKGKWPSYKHNRLERQRLFSERLEPLFGEVLLLAGKKLTFALAEMTELFRSVDLTEDPFPPPRNPDPLSEKTWDESYIEKYMESFFQLHTLWKKVQYEMKKEIGTFD